MSALSKVTIPIPSTTDQCKQEPGIKANTNASYIKDVNSFKAIL